MDVFTLCQHKQKKAHQRAVPNHVMSFNKKQDLIHYSGGELPDTLAFKSSCLLLNDQHLWIQNTETEMCDIFLEMFQLKNIENLMSPHLFVVVNDKGAYANTVRCIGRKRMVFFGNPIHKHQVVFLRVMKPESLLHIIHKPTSE